MNDHSFFVNANPAKTEQACHSAIANWLSGFAPCSVQLPVDNGTHHLKYA